MKHLCCSRFLFTFLFLTSSLFASLNSKSSIIYYGEDISYPMVGIHDYIIVEPKNTDIYTHGFSIYNEKIYARVSTKEKNLKDKLETYIDDGYKHFFLDFDSGDENKLIKIIKTFNLNNPHSKLIVRGNNNVIKKLADILTAVVISNGEENDIEYIKSFGIDIIKVEFKNVYKFDESYELAKSIESKGMIPYISNDKFDLYGVSSKNAHKREILTLIDESKMDRTELSAHRHGALVFEYLGYIQKLYDVQKGLPDINKMHQYAGVVVWLSVDYKYPEKLIAWVKELQKLNIKVAFAGGFGASLDGVLLKSLGINAYDGNPRVGQAKTVIQKDPMIGYEIEPALDETGLYFHLDKGKPLLTYEDQDKLTSIPAAITQWGGYALNEAFLYELNDDVLWIINPFKFFAEALRLPKIPIPDTTTENGNRLLFTHIDGDGIMSYVESNPEFISGEILFEKILKKYKIPHSLSIIGAEVRADGLYPEMSTKVNKLVKKIYALDNIEGATHTYSHPFIWSQIKNDDLNETYRLKVDGYEFSIDYEIKEQLQYINENLQNKNKKKANMVFWSGDCNPGEEILKYIYKNRFLNINGGDTWITKSSPWLSYVSPIGVERGGYYQIYTGAQNENVYTNNWVGPFWGFKKAVQTFQMTESPRRLKPINIYYHIYSGSKIASLNALKYVLDWSLKQDVMPVFTSEYIVKAMDYFTVSMANEQEKWLVEGMKNLKTLRLEDENIGVDLDISKTVLGIKHFENHTYISLDPNSKHIVQTGKFIKSEDNSYLLRSNGKIKSFTNGIKNKHYQFDGHVDLELSFYVSKECKLKSNKKASKIVRDGNVMNLFYTNTKKVGIDVSCR